MRKLNRGLSTWMTHAVRVLAMLAAFKTRRQRLRLLVVWLALEAKFWLDWWPGRSFKLTWRGPRGDVSARVGNISELWAIWQIFVREEYACVAEVAPDVILDLGANIGIAALYFHAVCPQARIVSVEALPETYALLARNTARLDGVRAVHAAVTDAVGTVTIYSGATTLASSLTSAADLPHAHTVPATTLERLAEEVGYGAADFVKLDVEGAEAQVIRASAPSLAEARAIVFEFHHEQTRTSVWSLLEALPGFRVARISGDTAAQAVVELSRAR